MPCCAIARPSPALGLPGLYPVYPRDGFARRAGDGSPTQLTALLLGEWLRARGRAAGDLEAARLATLARLARGGS